MTGMGLFCWRRVRDSVLLAPRSSVWPALTCRWHVIHSRPVRIPDSFMQQKKPHDKHGTFFVGGELGIRTLGGFTLTAFRVLSVEHHFEENKGRTEKLREDKNTNNSSIFRLFSVKNRGVSRVRMNHINLLKNRHLGEI